MPVHVGETALDAVVVEGEAFVVETEEVEDGGVEVVRGDGVVRGLESKLIGGAVAHAAFHSGTGKPSGEAVRIMVAPVGAGLKHWHAAELGGEHYERVFQQAALFQIAQQAGDGLVEDAAVHVVFCLLYTSDAADE